MIGNFHVVGSIVSAAIHIDLNLNDDDDDDDVDKTEGK